MDNMIGQRIKDRRKELKITQLQIQAQTSLSSGNLSCIENGRYLPSATALIELSKVLHCSIDWILTGDSSISNSSFFLDNKESELINCFRQLDADEQDEFLEFINIRLRRSQRGKSNTAKSSPSIITDRDDKVG